MLVVQFLVNVENVDMQATEGSEGEECLPTPGYNLQFCYNESTFRLGFYGPRPTEQRTYRVSQKKGCSKFEGHFRPLNGRKSKKVTPKTPPKIQFYLLGGVFSPVYNPYTPCIHHVYHASEWYIMQVFTWQLHEIKYYTGS